MFLLACAIEGDVHQGLWQQISTDADGRWKAPGRWGSWAGPLSPFSPTFSFESLSCFIAYSFTHTLSLFPYPSLLCYFSSEDGVGSDKVWGLIDGQSWRLDERMDEGRGGSLTQANTERQRGTTCPAMQPLAAPQQFSPQLTQCQWTPSFTTYLVTVHMNNCDSKQRPKKFSAHEEQYTCSCMYPKHKNRYSRTFLKEQWKLGLLNLLFLKMYQNELVCMNLSFMKKKKVSLLLGTGVFTVL